MRRPFSVLVAVIAVANPDGLQKQTRTNANGVDINRNFPASNWQSSLRKTQYYNGPAPASERIDATSLAGSAKVKSSQSMTTVRRPTNLTCEGW